jgi:hypothetical protein
MQESWTTQHFQQYVNDVLSLVAHDSMDNSSKLYQNFQGCTPLQTLAVPPLVSMILAKNNQPIVCRCFRFWFDFSTLSRGTLLHCWPWFVSLSPYIQRRISNSTTSPGVHASRCFLVNSYVLVGLAKVVRSQRLIFQDQNIRFAPSYIYIHVATTHVDDVFANFLAWDTEELFDISELPAFLIDAIKDES